MDGFAQVKAYFAETSAWLECGEAASLPHGELEDRVGERDRERQRRTFQGHLDSGQPRKGTRP